MTVATGQAEQRAQIMAALSGLTVTIDGAEQALTAHPTRPAPVTAFDAWPMWMATRPVTWCVDELDWTVLVALPGPDAQTFVAAGDELVDVVAAALEHWQLTRIEPVQILVAEGQSIPGLQYALTI